MASPGAPLGNQNGLKGRVFHDALRRAIAKRDISLGEEGKTLVQVATALLGKAIDGGDMAAIVTIRDTLDGKPSQQIEGDIKVVLEFRRQAEEFSGDVIEVKPGREEIMGRLLSAHEGAVRQTLRLVLDEVPDDDLEGVYQQALPTVLETARRGESEKPMRELVHKQGVYEASEGYGVSLDTQTQEERQQVEDALQKVEEHNRRVRGRR